MWDATFFLVITTSFDQEMFSISVDAGFVLVLPFQHGDLEPDWGGGGLMQGIKIHLQDFVLKMQGGLCTKGAHYSTVEYNCSLLYYQLIFERLIGCMTEHFLQVYSNQILN